MFLQREHVFFIPRIDLTAVLKNNDSGTRQQKHFIVVLYLLANNKVF